MPEHIKKSREKITGKVYYHRNFRSDYLDNERDIIVWLPPSYKFKSGKKLPVLYMHDGQNIMDPGTSFAGSDWRVDETAASLIKQNKIEEIMVVGIYNTASRMEEYSYSPQGQNYIRFITEELKPFIESNYPAKSSRENNAIMGSSMGGLISFIIVWKHGDVFSKAACLSSSFYYNDEKVIKMVNESQGNKKNIKIYLDHGEDGLHEGQKMFAALSAKGYLIGTDVDYFYEPGAEHNETAWAGRLARPLIFLFPAEK